jgi:putative phosphoribosyl transferase
MQAAMLFHDRKDAGQQLAGQLREYAGRKDAIVLGIPRGGVVVARQVAQALHLPLDVFLSRKLGVPWQPELAFGAITTDGDLALDEQSVRELGITQAQIADAAQRALTELHRRKALYRGQRPCPELRGKTIILVDDGIATGASITAALQALRQKHPAKLVAAVPVAPASTCLRISTLTDQLVCLHQPPVFEAVGQFYRSFPQVKDTEVLSLLSSAPTGPPA